MDNVDNFVYNFIFPRFKCILAVDNFWDNFSSLFITFFVPRYFVHVVYSAKNKKTFLIHRTETAFEAMSEKE